MIYPFRTENFKTISELRENISTSIEKLKDSGQPLIITQQGKPAAVMLDVASYQQLTEDYEVIAGILRGLRDSQAGRVFTSDNIREQLKANGRMD